MLLKFTEVLKVTLRHGRDKLMSVAEVIPVCSDIHNTFVQQSTI